MAAHVGVDVAQVGAHAEGADDVVEAQLADQRGELEEHGDRLANAATRAEHGDDGSARGGAAVRGDAADVRDLPLLAADIDRRGLEVSGEVGEAGLDRHRRCCWRAKQQRGDVGGFGPLLMKMHEKARSQNAVRLQAG